MNPIGILLLKTARRITEKIDLLKLGIEGPGKSLD
jgi:hypothetical protein